MNITCEMHLANNENPLGASPLVLAALSDIPKLIHLYPDHSYPDLKKAIAAFYSFHQDQITLGNGSENILELIIKTYLNHHQNAIISEYTFRTIPLLIDRYGIKKFIKTNAFQNDLESMLAAIDEHTRLLFLVNPNNPTGTYVNKDNFLTFLQAIPKHVMIVVDEAYSEFIDASDFPNAHLHLSQFPNLIVTRTFSKGYGLASLRLGYALSNVEVAKELEHSRLPFNVNTIAAYAGMLALQDSDHLHQTITHIKLVRKQLEQGLKQLQLSYLPSLGNFISVKVGNAEKISQKLKAAGINIRPLTDYGLPDYIRVSLGKENEIAAFLHALSSLLP